MLLLVSCKQYKADSKKAAEFYESVHQQMIANKEKQRQFVDKMAMTLLSLKDNPDIIIDTEELQSLLVASKEKNYEREKNIEKFEEIDKDIDLKQKTLDYIKVFNNAYRDEFPKTIHIFSEKSADRFERAKEILNLKLQLIKEKQVEMENAFEEFKEKYTENSQTYHKLTEPDFEFVKLKDFVFTPATISKGTKIELLSFSGGDDYSGETIYYKQFIGIDKSTGDTLRILALAPMQDYDVDKASRIGTYTIDLPMRTQMTASENEYIIFNKNHADTEKGNFKTVFGILTFDE